MLSDTAGYFTDAVTLANPDIDSATLAAWVLHASICQAGQHCTYLVINSDTGNCGKTSLISAIGHILPGARLLAMPTIAALQRMAADILLIDQADTLMQARSTDQYLFTGWLNSGHTKGFNNPLSNPEDITGTIDRSPFGSRALAGISLANMLDDNVLARSVIVQMRTQSREDNKRERMNASELMSLAETLARRITKWAGKNAQVICAQVDNARYTTLADGTEIHNREYDIWGPLVTICRNAGDGWYKRITDAANNGTDPENAPEQMLAQTIDSELLSLMRSKRVTVSNWTNRNAPPIPDHYNFPVSNDDLGWPMPRYGTKALPGASLVLNTERNAAELRFMAATFNDVCAALRNGMGRKKRTVTAAYKDAGRLHATSNRSSLQTPMFSGQGDSTLICIDVSHWFWTDQPPGMSRTEKEITRILKAETEDDVWGAD